MNRYNKNSHWNQGYSEFMVPKLHIKIQYIPDKNALEMLEIAILNGD